MANNIIDLTFPAERSHRPRAGIRVSASESIVCNNQVCVRNAADPGITGIEVVEYAVCVSLHDNLIRACGYGIHGRRCQGKVVKVLDGGRFLKAGVPDDRGYSHGCQGWKILWLSGESKGEVSEIAVYDARTTEMALREPCRMKEGDSFEFFPPSAEWDIHHNVISECLRPVVLDVYGGTSSLFRDNLVSRGRARNVRQALVLRGRVRVSGNHFAGFDEPGAAAIVAYPDVLGRDLVSLCSGNTFDECRGRTVSVRTEMFRLPDKTLFRADPEDRGERLGREGPDLREDGWDRIGTRMYWRDQTINSLPEEKRGFLRTFPGPAWYRFHVTVPKTWKTGEISLHVDAIRDDDRTYVNGRLVAETTGLVRAGRDYPVPKECLRFGQDNVIAIRILQTNPASGPGAGMSGFSYLSMVRPGTQEKTREDRQGMSAFNSQGLQAFCEMS